MQSKESKVCFLDFQFGRCCSPALDIAGYLLASTNKQVLERCDDLLKVYHNALNDLMRKLGSDPNIWFTLDDLVAQLKTVGRYGLIVAASTIQVELADPQNVCDLNDVKDASQTPTDLATLDELTSNIFKERISDAVKYAKRFGWV